MSSLKASMIARGGRHPITKECANDEGYGHANRPLVRKIIQEHREAMEYDPRFDFRETGQDNIEQWQAERRNSIDEWQMRKRFAV